MIQDIEFDFARINPPMEISASALKIEMGTQQTHQTTNLRLV